jgi:N-acetylglucosaminyldiphosphoundecaprenol N-acetyl-beta-D-mannosaminyltransferase
MTPIHTAANDVPGAAPPPTCELYGMTLARLGMKETLDRVFSELAAGRGGWLVTANLDFLRRHVKDPQARALYDQADLSVADGMPLVWAARLQGDHLPERVAGSSMVTLLAARAAAEKRSLYFLGGAPGAAAKAAAILTERHPGLQICGTSSPMLSSPPTAAELEPIRAELSRLGPALLLVGLGSPKQEQLIQLLRPSLPATWMVGVGISFSFIAGDVRRAPPWMQRTGLEWVHRMAQEPRRLGHRYLVEDLPFAFSLFWHALRRRVVRQTMGNNAR